MLEYVVDIDHDYLSNGNILTWFNKSRYNKDIIECGSSYIEDYNELHEVKFHDFIDMEHVRCKINGVFIKNNKVQASLTVFKDTSKIPQRIVFVTPNNVLPITHGRFYVQYQ